ncbi:unnamed protein product [Brachionus calyciflorus]|uniref:Uncharacterized protein n=1 Tax=Brachionus calyciflorus TaxID=104777 RepID=A0A814MUS6_9BILA|nr:unnamed protein product [Brachionus calyciflorus]
MGIHLDTIEYTVVNQLNQEPEARDKGLVGLRNNIRKQNILTNDLTNKAEDFLKMIKGLRSFRKVIREEPVDNMIIGERLASLNGSDFILSDKIL